MGIRLIKLKEMNLKFFYAISCLVLITACESTYLPFKNMADKQESLKLIKSKVSLKKEEFNAIKNKDSILYELSVSVKDIDIKQKLIRRRLDSFFLNAYTEEELKSSLELDRVFKGYTIEIDRNINPHNALNINSFKDLKKLRRKLDEQKKNAKFSIIRDSTKIDSLRKPKKKG